MSLPVDVTCKLCEGEPIVASNLKTRALHGILRACTNNSDDEIAALSTALNASLDGIDALLAMLPQGPVEPSLLRLELDEGELLSFIRTGVPTHVCLGRPLQFELAVSDNYPSRAPAELEAAAASLAFYARVTGGRCRVAPTACYTDSCE
jgi:hypothetical protein